MELFISNYIKTNWFENKITYNITVSTKVEYITQNDKLWVEISPQRDEYFLGPFIIFELTSQNNVTQLHFLLLVRRKLFLLLPTHCFIAFLNINCYLALLHTKYKFTT